MQKQYINNLQKIEEKTQDELDLALDVATVKKIIQADAQVRRDREFLSFVQAAKNIIENIPSIGDHFLPIFNNLILWRAVPILGKAAGVFAAENVDFGNDDDFAQLKQLDPQAQLIYFFEAPITIDNVYRAYEWLKELIETPAIITEKNNHSFLDQISDRITAFVLINIEEIFKKYPKLEMLMQDPALARAAFRLHQGLQNNPEIAFEKVVMNFPKNTYDADLINLGENRVGVLYKQILHVFNAAKNYKLEQKIDVEKYFALPKKGQKPIGYCALGQNKIVAYSGTQLAIFDLTSSAEPVTIMLPQVSIKELQPLNEHQLLLSDLNNLLVFDIPTQKIVTIFRLSAIQKLLVFDPANVVILVKNGELILVDVTGKSLKYKKTWDLFDAIMPQSISLNRINAVECGVSGQVMPTGILNRFIASFFLLNVANQVLTPLGTVDIGSVFEGVQRVISLGTNFFLTSRGILWHIPTQTPITFTQPLRDSMALDKNHVALVLKNSPQVIIKFVPQTSTLAEILAEIKKHTASQQPSQQPQKRPAPQEAVPFIPAAAQGARTEVPEVKRPRSEKEEKSQ